MKCYRVHRFWEESRSLYRAYEDRHDKPDAVELHETDDWRPRYKVIDPVGYGTLQTDNLCSTLSDVAEAVARDRLQIEGAVGVRKVRYRYEDISQIGYAVEPSAGAFFPATEDGPEEQIDVLD